MALRVKVNQTPDRIYTKVARTGVPGATGADGLTAYELAVSEGFAGTLSEWIESLQGIQGEQGIPGQDGIQGEQGIPGQDGADGQDGIQGIQGEQGIPGQDGADGLSAYELAVSEGFIGTLQEYLDSLVGPSGASNWLEIDGKPSVFPPEDHEHVLADITDAGTAASFNYTESDTPPENPNPGDTWLNTLTLIKYTRYDGFWVDTTGAVVDSATIALVLNSGNYTFGGNVTFGPLGTTTLSSALILNSTSYAFGTGSAAALRDAAFCVGSDPSSLPGHSGLTRIKHKFACTAAQHAALVLSGEVNSETEYSII
jgi:hypothetical protein